MNQLLEHRSRRLRSLTETLGAFDYGDETQLEHFHVLSQKFGELAAISLVSQDVEHNGANLELTDGGAIDTWPGWGHLNRVVRHGEVSRYTIFDATRGHLIALFTRDQTVPTWAQPEA